jgi:hypothetical protein
MYSCHITTEAHDAPINQEITERSKKSQIRP